MSKPIERVLRRDAGERLANGGDQVGVVAGLRAAEARRIETLTAAVAAALRNVTRQDAINWFASCGYSII